MKIKKGEKIVVRCSRKGTYNAIAAEDFDTQKDEWFTVVLDQKEPVIGLTQSWLKGDEVPCRKGHSRIFRRKV